MERLPVLIVLRIARVHGQVAQYVSLQPTKFYYAVRIIIESGLMYTITASALLVTILIGGNADYIPADAVSSLEGIQVIH